MYRSMAEAMRVPTVELYCWVFGSAASPAHSFLSGRLPEGLKPDYGRDMSSAVYACLRAPRASGLSRRGSCLCGGCPPGKDKDSSSWVIFFLVFDFLLG